MGKIWIFQDYSGDFLSNRVGNPAIVAIVDALINDYPPIVATVDALINDYPSATIMNRP